MPLTIKVKRGTSAPGTGVLELAELGFDSTGNKLYVGKGAGNAPVGVSMDGHTHSSITGVLPIANGGTNSSTADGALNNLGGTTVGKNLFKLTNPSAIRYIRILADNTIEILDSNSFRNAIGAQVAGLYAEESHGHYASDIVDLTVALEQASVAYADYSGSSGVASSLSTTLGVSGGGTGATTFTTGQLLIGDGASAVTTRAITDSSSNSAIGTGTSIPTERDIYYGLVNVNNASQTRATTIYAPTTGGTAGFTLKALGTSSTPAWYDPVDYVGAAQAAQNTLMSIAFTSGTRAFLVDCLQDSTTSSYKIGQFVLSVDDTYSVGATTRYYRMTWFNGSGNQNLTLQYYITGNTIYFQHNFAFTMGIRLFAI